LTKAGLKIENRILPARYDFLKIRKDFCNFIRRVDSYAPDTKTNSIFVFFQVFLAPSALGDSRVVMHFFGVFLLILTRKVDTAFGDVTFDQVFVHMMIPRDAINFETIQNMCVLSSAAKILILLGGLGILLNFLLIFQPCHDLLSKALYCLINRMHAVCLLLALCVFLIGTRFDVHRILKEWQMHKLLLHRQRNEDCAFKR